LVNRFHQTTAGFFCRIYKIILKFIWKNKGCKVSKTVIPMKVGKLAPSDDKGSYKAKENKAVWYWHKDRHTDPQAEHSAQK
jgi:hypothetical protein